MIWKRKGPDSNSDKTVAVGSVRGAVAKPSTQSEESNAEGDRTVFVRGPKPPHLDAVEESKLDDVDADSPKHRLSWPARATSSEHGTANQTIVPRNDDDTGDDVTRLYRPNDQSDLEDLVVGWLVIIGGPGKGRSFELGLGTNSVGRSTNQKVRLDFGDTAIHREKHASVVYDPEGRRFFLQAGNDTRNLTYLGRDLVLLPVQLTGGETITIGKTTLRFVALCGPSFDWA